MIHYHGMPITPGSAAIAAISRGHAFLSFRYPDQLGIVLDVCRSFAVDNGAFSAWRSGNPIKDWTPYFEWLSVVSRFPKFDFAVIPDVIDGEVQDNIRLYAAFREYFHERTDIGAMVWHMHEPLEHLAYLVHVAGRQGVVCLGSSGEFASVGNAKWWDRMGDAMGVACDEYGFPKCRLHGLRMLDPRVFGKLPLASADSTNIARNIGIDLAWVGTYTPPNKEVRAMVLRERIESHQAAHRWQPPGK